MQYESYWNRTREARDAEEEEIDHGWRKEDVKSIGMSRWKTKAVDGQEWKNIVKK